MNRCGDCHHSHRCEWLLGDSYSSESAVCDWDPSRFKAQDEMDRENALYREDMGRFRKLLEQETYRITGDGK